MESPISTEGHDGKSTGKSRATRRLLVGATVVATCGAIAVSGLLTANADTKSDAAAPAVLQAAARPAADAPPPPENKPVGEVVSTGIHNKAGELVFYAVKVDEPKAIPGVHFGVMAGYRTASGEVTADYLANETKGSDKAAGFHAVSASVTVDDHAVPAFGYYAGPAAKITATVHGKTIEAHVAKWSEDANVVVFWFDPADLGTAEPGDLAAFDAAGKALPEGNSSVGHG